MGKGGDEISPAHKAGLLVAAISLMVSMGLTIELAWRIAPFKTTRIVFSSELLKLTTAIYLSRREPAEIRTSASVFFTAAYWQENKLFAAPAFIYFLTNNMASLAQKYLSAHLVALMANMKVVMAAGIAYRIMGQRFTRRQIAALCIIVFGLVIMNSNPGKKHGSAQEFTTFTIFLTVIYGLVMSTLSSIAGVLCEYLYKPREGVRKMSFNEQNINMYTFGVLFNILGMFLQGSGSSNDGSAQNETVFFHWSHAIMICLSAFTGILMGAIMKYLDNVIRNLAVCVGTIVITLLSWLVFKNPLTIQFVIGGLLVLGSVLLYRLSPPPK